LGLEPIVIGADSDDLAPFHDFLIVQGAPLAKVKSLLAGASFFIGNDSGPAHMAAAFGLPVVVIFGDSNPAIWGPWRTASEVVTAPGGIGQVAIAHVISALERLRVHA
jgi:ADP-heptose:LPS heptosyltransferase